MFKIYLKFILKALNFISHYMKRDLNYLLYTLILLIEKKLYLLLKLNKSLIFNEDFNSLINYRVNYLFTKGHIHKASNLFNKYFKKNLIYAIDNSDEICLDFKYLSSFGEFGGNIDTFLKHSEYFVNSLYNSGKVNGKFKCYVNFKQVPNISLLRLWSKYINFVDYKKKKFTKKRFFINTRWIPDYFNGSYSDYVFVDYVFLYPKINNVWQNKFKKRSLIEIDKGTKKKAETYLKNNFKLKNFENLALIHINNLYNDKFNHDKHRLIKNFENFSDSIKYLKNNNYKIFLTSTKKINGLQNTFSILNKPSFVSLYLLSFSKLVINTYSGPNMIPYIFDNNCIWTNVCPFHSLPPLPRDLYIFKKLKLNNKILFYEIFNKFFNVTNFKDFKKLGIFLEENSSEEILYAVKEFIKKDLSNNIYLRKKYNSYVKKFYLFEQYSNISLFFLEKNYKNFIDDL